MTVREMRALLVPHLRKRTRLLAIEKPVVPPLVELAPMTDDIDEPALIAALDDPDSVAVYADWLEQHGFAARAHWLRIYPDGDLLVRTRFGGTPAATRGAPWPTCTCGDPLRFVGQVSGGDAPDPWYQLLAFYYCWHCHRRDEQYCGGRERPYEGWLVRAYHDVAPGALVRLAPPADTPLFRETFVRAVSETSLPHFLAFAAQVRADEVPVLEQVASALCELPRDAVRNTGLAVGGYPQQFPSPDEAPRCDLCHTVMTLELQLAPDPALDATWGGGGAMLVFVCAEHRTRFALRTQMT